MAVRMAKDRFCKVFPPDFAAKRIHMKDIVEAGVLRDVYVQGVIETAYPVHKAKRGKLCKLVLKEGYHASSRENDGTLMNAFFFGKIAEQCYPAQKGDTVVFRDVVIEQSPVLMGHKFQLVVNRARSDVSVWFVSGHSRKRTVRASEFSALKEQREKRKKRAICESEDEDVHTDKENVSEVSSSVSSSQEKQVTLRRSRRVHLGPRGVSPSACENAELQNVVSLNRGISTTSLTATATGDAERTQQDSETQESSCGSPVSRKGRKLQNLVVQIEKLDTAHMGCTVPYSSRLPASSSQESDSVASEGAGDIVLSNETDSQCSSTTMPGTPSGHFSPPTVRRSMGTCGSPSISAPGMGTCGSPDASAPGILGICGSPDASAPGMGTCGSPDASAPGILGTCGSPDASAPGMGTCGSPHNSAPGIGTCGSPSTSVSGVGTCGAPSTSAPVPDPQNDASISSQVPSLPDATYTVPAGYTKLAALKDNSVANVYGVVKFFKPPWKSRGTDMCSVVLLMDPSLPQSNEETGFECVLFQPNTSSLPQILSVGDIVRLHRIKVNRFRECLQAKSSKGFAAVVFDQDPNIVVSEHTARVSSSTFTFSAEDQEVVLKLKDYFVSRQDLFQPSLCCTVAGITPNTYFDVVCQVLTVAQHQNIDCVVLRVSDGTELQNETQHYGNDSFQVISLQPGDMPSVDVFLFGEHAAIVRQLNVTAGTFVKLHNVHAQVHQQSVGVSLLDELNPMLELCVHRGTAFGRGLNILSADSSQVQMLTDRMQQQQQ